jgi:hypothetical protein
MKIIAIPELLDSTVLNTCISSIGSQGLRDRINEVFSYIIGDGQLYRERAESNELHTLSPLYINDDELALGRVTKKELTSLYTNYLVPNTKPGREIYDALMIRAPLFKCPFCGLNQVSTLDHFLPKAKFPTLSVIPVNLVPACKDCNTRKSSTVASIASSQPLHPYFDREPFQTDQWLFARVIDTQPMAVVYEILPPDSWSSENKNRVQTHFDDFDLYYRYSIEAASELASQEYIFKKHVDNRDYDSLISDLEDRYYSHERLSINSWQTALYKALLEFYRNKFESIELTPLLETGSEIESCPRCLGKKRLLGSLCDACNGVGAATANHFISLGGTVYEPVICECPDGFLNCRICHGSGRVDLERARNIAVE